MLHHIELQVHDLDGAVRAWGWLLGRLGYEEHQRWDGGRSWRQGGTYLVVARAPQPHRHDRRGSGLNHLAFHAGSRDEVERLWREAPEHGWARLYTDRHPWAGGPEHYAAFLEDGERSKVELVAREH